MLIKNQIKIIISLFTAFLLVFLLSKNTQEITPKILAKKIINILPKNIVKVIYKEKQPSSFSKIVLSKEKLEKVNLYYNNEEFEVYVDPNIELSQQKIKILYYYWKLMNQKR